MKNFFACLSLLVVVNAVQPVVAGPGDQGKAEARATQLTKQLAQKTQLSEGQYVRVRQLNLRMITEMQELQASLAADPATLDKKLAELQSHYEWDLTAIIGPRQMVAYNQSRINQMAFSGR
ncbi:hypothetical protein J0X19_13975 [Hymenobacter sp. BT186]|uniref:Periplasmic heavy metal sensor n=1 Tax=Hymenobacter telluris TaxID=2816474 RepID=A0A939F075_9BACT|nr:hypothetical protein [Hymenobacter telluris]MBO0359063.1 hypothetical protein [Hymenobacter telluris]MBW3375089.1 hypothetical protein [Hymenobacter norwichensis]